MRLYKKILFDNQVSIHLFDINIQKYVVEVAAVAERGVESWILMTINNGHAFVEE